MPALHIMASNPFRPADWMWQRAVEIVDRDGPRASRKRDGLKGFKWINKAVSFLRAYQRASEDEAALARLATKRPHIFWAHTAWSSATNVQKHLIEAHLLARTDDFSIAFRCDMDPAVITAYEALFFNVKEKLEHRSYILNCVMGPAIHRGLSEREHDLLWKLYGYFLGPYIVDALESKFANPVWCGTPDAVGASVLDDAVSTLKLKAALAAKTVSVNQGTQLALMEQFTKFVEVERNTDSAGKAQEQVLDHIHAMMTTLPFSIGRKKEELFSVTHEFNTTAAELTYEETMRVSVGKDIIRPEVLRRLEFPQTESTQILEA